MEIEQVGLSPADTGRIRACFEVMLAAERVDHPGEPWFTEQPFTGWITVGWDGSPREVWLATDQGQAVGWYRLDLPARENLDQGGLEIVVHPASRQRGIGRALLQHAAGRAAGHGRTVLNGGARDGSPGEAFARAASIRSLRPINTPALLLRSKAATPRCPSGHSPRRSARRSSIASSRLKWPASV